MFPESMLSRNFLARLPLGLAGGAEGGGDNVPLFMAPADAPARDSCEDVLCLLVPLAG